MIPPQGQQTIERVCRLAGVSRAGYYRHWRASAPRAEETALRDEVQKLALAHRSYGSRRVTALLRRQGWCINRKRVSRVMREDNLLCVRRAAFVPVTTDSRHSWRIYPNLARWLRPTAPNQLWVADITYVRLAEEFAYLAVLLDAFSRAIIGWALAEHLRAELTLSALRMALAKRTVAAGALVHHSDRGVQYACQAYVGVLESHGIQPSMSRVGCPYDNAMAESFMKSLKAEQIDGRIYRDRDAAAAGIVPFLETVYNCERLHSALGYCTPAEIEQSFVSPTAIAPPGIAGLEPATSFRAEPRDPGGKEERI